MFENAVSPPSASGGNTSTQYMMDASEVTQRATQRRDRERFQ